MHWGCFPASGNHWDKTQGVEHIVVGFDPLLHLAERV